MKWNHFTSYRMKASTASNKKTGLQNTILGRKLIIGKKKK